MNDVERRLKGLGERASEDVARQLRPRPEALRRIRLRRAALSTTALACVATVVAAGAFAWTAEERDAIVRPVPPAAESPSAERDCASLVFEPTYVPEGFDRRAEYDRGGATPGLVATFPSDRPASIQVTTPEYAFVQTRPRHVRVLGEPASIGLIHEGYSVAFHHDGCEYVLNGYGITKEELKRFATGLVEGRVTPEGDPAMVVWPEDTIDAAEEACAEAGPRERTNPQVVSGFAMDVLGWDSPIYEAPRTSSAPWVVFPSERATFGGDVEAGVRVWTTEVVPGCWSIRSVSRLADRRPTGVGVSVDGEIVEVTYDPLGSTTVMIEVGYGGRNRRFHNRFLDAARIWLRFTPDTTGHVFVLLRDEDGDVFTAYATPLPAGDFSAG